MTTSIIALAAVLAAALIGLLAGIRVGAEMQRRTIARRFAQVLGRHEHKDQEHT